MKVSVLHMEIRPTLEENLTAAKTAILKAAKQKPALIALPEYFTVPNCMADFTDAAKISAKKPATKPSISSRKSPQKSATSTSSAAPYSKKTTANTTTPAHSGKTAP